MRISSFFEPDVKMHHHGLLYRMQRQGLKTNLAHGSIYGLDVVVF